MADPIRSIDPTDGRVIASYERMDDEAISAAVEEADARHRSWRRLPYDTRAEHLRRVAGSLEDRRDELADLMAAEMGKPLGEGRAEVDKCAWVCRHY
ncbi:MAG: aldehyde dehydrogenase family protein, partial [Actinomycetota bacterium]